MPTALVKLTTASGTGGYMGVPPEGKGIAKPTKDAMGLLVPASNAEIIAGTDKGQIVEEVKANQIVRIRPSILLTPSRYTILQGYNPELAEMGSVSQSAIAQPRREDLYVVVKAYRAFRPDELEWMFIFYMAL
jgi:hypothetical protein